MVRLTYMVVGFLFRFVSKKENIIPLWVKSMPHKTLILLPTLSKTFIKKFFIKVNIIITTTQQVSLNLTHHLLDLRYSTQTTQIIGIFNKKSILLTTCKIHKENLVLQEVTCFYSICQTTWKILNFISSLKSSEIFWVQG